jgi:predicted DNA-binding antitoxin AbrB/MazE fold protein
MIQRVDAVFENGVFRPEEPVHIANGERVSLNFEAKKSSIDDLSDVRDLLDEEFVEVCRERSANAPSLTDIQTILSVYKGSLADMIFEEREER